ncbi:uncharacterized protein CELE_C48B4.7 [Caenorhabditis elegans]|uniref:Uncharacterized protein C48B4.7 n=1 Tax=Caenorhabditis elegans TaxID=6239 RepID=YLH7_CAEEL|nr:Uncharacterized protein CELE_C48B4.7 [Caenorhabditis elegans]P34361.1 RecName: Full=Uncharacterized protein C48B4.7 [Caenorhabditis elegans]CAA82379.1 Uncharacterized protein CELE_C48B4.7 [Caenorhabditis elegans]|eukprot:NP_499110.1 Uncharacterized protein CELE_C48B4.7 [Caenorhabditis elegans]
MTHFETRPLCSLNSPLLCGFFPIKLAVLLVQLIAIVIQFCMLYYNGNQEEIVFVAMVLLLVFTISSFVAFLGEYGTMMAIHYYVSCILLIWPAVVFIMKLISLCNKLFIEENATSRDAKDFMKITAILFAVIFYIWMCLQLIRVAKSRLILPRFTIRSN